MMTLDQRLNRLIASLSDDELECECQRAERIARCCVRARRDLALCELRCLRRERQRRAAEPVVASL